MEPKRQSNTFALEVSLKVLRKAVSGTVGHGFTFSYLTKYDPVKLVLHRFVYYSHATWLWDVFKASLKVTKGFSALQPSFFF